MGRCELPASGVISFLLKAHYDKINIDVSDPLLVDDDSHPGAEPPDEARLARAPQDLGDLSEGIAEELSAVPREN